MVHITKISLVAILLLIGLVSLHADYDNLYHIDDCLYLYLSGITFSIIHKTESGELEPWHGNLTILGIDSSTCHKDHSNLIITGKETNKLPEMYLNFTINRVQDWWELTKFEANVTKNTNTPFQLSNYSLTPSNFWPNFPADESFSCGSLDLQSIGESYPRLSFKLKSFQLQPFKYSKNAIFAPNYDCSVWLTLPMISGFALILFMTFVVLILIYLMIELGEQTRDLKFSKQGGMLMNQSQLEATK